VLPDRRDALCPSPKIQKQAAFGYKIHQLSPSYWQKLPFFVRTFGIFFHNLREKPKKTLGMDVALPSLAVETIHGLDQNHNKSL
jgi:hypothetical protein